MTELTEDRIKQIRHIPSKSKYQWDILIECYDLKEADSFRQQILQALSLEKRVRELINADSSKCVNCKDGEEHFHWQQKLQQLLGDKA